MTGNADVVPAMAITSIPSVLLPLRAPGLIPAYTPPVALSPQGIFNRIVDSSLTTGAPLPALGLQNAVSGPDGVSLLQQSYFRDLVSGVGTPNTGLSALSLTPSFIEALGVDGQLGRNGLPAALQGVTNAESLKLFSSALALFDSIQALGTTDEIDSATLGGLLDVTA